MKIVVLDGYAMNPGDMSWESLGEYGDLKVYDRTPGDKIIERAEGAYAVFTNKTPLSGDVIGKLPDLKYIGVLATGYNVVDVDAANNHGIIVANVPGYSTDAVAQMVMALLLELCHHVGDHSREVREGVWSTSKDFAYWSYPLVELKGKIMGIIGFGQIGRAVAKLAAAFGMKILYNSRNPKEYARETGALHTGIEKLLSESDAVSLNCPLTELTSNLINADSLKLMKETAFLINTARGPVVNETDLAMALNTGSIAGAATDVLSREPADKDNPLLYAKNCIITPHIAWATKEARERLLTVTVDNFKAFMEGQPQNTVGPI